MTQEELDALMSDDSEALDGVDLPQDVDESKESQSEEVPDPEEYRVDATTAWPPPPPTDDHKMVHQLDDVTKESEEKATEIFDIIETISEDVMRSEESAETLLEILEANKVMFDTLQQKFPNVSLFKERALKNVEGIELAQSLQEVLQTSGDQIMNVMDIMQYQDIHRQKIERVINVMRALSKYMNELFAGNIDDSKRVASAHHLPGDSTDELVSADDIEALLASFGQN